MRIEKRELRRETALRSAWRKVTGCWASEIVVAILESSVNAGNAVETPRCVRLGAQRPFVLSNHRLL